MKILAFNYEYPPLGGGGGIAFRDIAEELARDHEVTVVTSLASGLPRRSSDSNLVIHRVPVLLRRSRATASMPSMVSYWPTSRALGLRLAKQNAFDVINSHFVVPSAPGAAAVARRFGIPHIISVHGGDLYDPSKRTSPHRLPVVRGMISRLLTRADRVVAQSCNTAANAREWYGVKRPIDVIPLGIRLSEPVRRDRRILDVSDDCFIMVTVGRLVKRKNISDLLQVVKRINDPRTLLVVIGDGPQRSELQARAQQLGVNEQIRLLGFVSEDLKRRWLAAADLFVSASLHEGFGLVFLEAMSAGLPVVCYDDGGQTDFLHSESTGYVVSRRDPEGLTSAVVRLRNDPGLRHQIGRNNQARVRSFSRQNCARRYAELFTEFLAKDRRTRVHYDGEASPPQASPPAAGSSTV